MQKVLKEETSERGEAMMQDTSPTVKIGSSGLYTTYQPGGSFQKLPTKIRKAIFKKQARRMNSDAGPMKTLKFDKVADVVHVAHAGACKACGKNRWKTVRKGKEYQCRTCGSIRVIVLNA